MGTIMVVALLVVALAVGWSVLWYYAASVTDRTMAGWMQREAAAGRVYSCGSQGISGFPFRIEVHCSDAAAELTRYLPPLNATAKDVTFAAQVYRPTLLTGTVASPLTLSGSGQPAEFVANWSDAGISVRGLPPEPDSLSFTLDGAVVERHEGAASAVMFKAEHADVSSRIVEGSAANSPVIDTVAKFAGLSLPTVHPLVAEPLQGDADVVVRGLKNLLPKPWPEHFRELAAAGGAIEVKRVRIDRPDATVLATGTVTINQNGRLDGQINVAVVGLENIVPLIGIDRLIGAGIDRLTGSTGQPGQGLGALDRLVPGLSGVVRQGAAASVIDNFKKMGQPTEIDKKPAVILPLRIADGSVYFGIIPLGELPPLF